MIRVMRAASLVFVASLCLFLSACGGKKISDEDFQKVKSGMTEQQVVDILGKPSETQEAGAGPMKAKSMIWKDGTKVHTVSLMDGKVMVTMSGDLGAKK